MCVSQSLFLKIELIFKGSILQVFNTNDYVKRRVLFGDKPIDLKTITFTNQRVYNLFGCRVELLPFGLPRRRSSNYWSNEYVKAK